MSSRTSGGKKKVKRILTESTSVPLKPQVVKVEFTPPPPQVIELKSEKEESKRNIVDWDVIGFSSAALTLLGAGLLFMLGWAYEVNWYGYFGVSMSQVTTQPPNIFIQSIPGLVTLAAMLSVSVITLVSFGAIRNMIEEKTINKREVFNTIDWTLVISFSVFYMLVFMLIYVLGGGGWRIQPALLVASEENYFPDSIKQTCKNSRCMSGPFGLIGENDNNYILIKWKEDNFQYFPYHPGIFIIPKSENTYLMPFINLPISSPSPQVSPTLTATLAVKPSFTPSIMPTLRPTITLTSTPIPSQP